MTLRISVILRMLWRPIIQQKRADAVPIQQICRSMAELSSFESHARVFSFPFNFSSMRGQAKCLISGVKVPLGIADH